MRGLGLGPQDRVILIEQPRGHGDWMKAEWLLQKDWTSEGAELLVLYIGVSADSALCTYLTTSMETLLLREWWPKHPDAGPPECPSATACVPKPHLRVLKWQGFGSGISSCPTLGPLQNWQFLSCTGLQKTFWRKSGWFRTWCHMCPCH